LRVTGLKPGVNQNHILGFGGKAMRQ
jgi:hypothetical protein